MNRVRFPAISAMSAAKHDMIQKLKQKVHYGKDIIEYSIIKSRCIKTSDRSGIFKHLFASLELATNSDRDEKIGGELDNKAPQLPTY